MLIIGDEEFTSSDLVGEQNGYRIAESSTAISATVVKPKQMRCSAGSTIA